jgi:phage shock protein A
MTSQLERLKQDAKELENYINKVQQKGKTDLVNKLSRKRTYLNRVIAEYQQQVVQ